ncbi:MAG: hypothetical protein KAY37_08680 [Phycisphaerae bacterium]|nr:hypothetical protein [Phycisphaerae bacterium]
MTNLPPELRDLTQRQERLRKALQAAQKANAKGQQKKGSSKKRSAKVPVADPDAAIMPNKEGGYAPNYNPVAAADGECGFIVDADVLAEMNEAESDWARLPRRSQSGKLDRSASALGGDAQCGAQADSGTSSVFIAGLG